MSCFLSVTEQVGKRPGRYDEMPKSATMENRHNLEHQFYATVQRYRKGGGAVGVLLTLVWRCWSIFNEFCKIVKDCCCIVLVNQGFLYGNADDDHS